ncbi:MAG TPA: amphi-Trp domain-containing protein [Streptosporangiaceae bacterium]|jgi:amphi-Trp domain-containing protein|nr:amphi-Trp domain-containing protein [Streptosporangiaceae bacterium]
MADVKVELKESISREDAARWLSQLSRAFANGHEGELPFGHGTVSMKIPDRVRAELEVEVEGNEVEVEIEFKWQIAEPEKALRPSDGAQTTARSGVTTGKRAASRK